MATYGLQTTPGSVAFTGYTNSLGSGQANVPANSGTVYFNALTQDDAKLARVFRKSGASAGVISLLYTLIGAASGSTATKTKKQVQGVQGGTLTGNQPIETVNLMNRATTAADITAFQALLNRVVQPSSYPADLSGNGGGGKISIPGGGAY